MTRSIFTERYRHFRRFLKQKRKDKNLTQWELARQLNMPLSFVGKYEQGERRLDIIELMDIAEVLDLDDIILEIDNKSMTNRPDLWENK